MQQPDNPLTRIERQLERLDELTRMLATRADLAELRREVVQTAVLEPQLSSLKTQIQALEKRIDEMEKEQVSRSERLWSKLSPAIAAIALLITLFEFFARVRLVP